jgi:AcrR family transcriptional regulator
MPRLRKTEREKVLVETRQRLLEAAAAEFARGGYGDANINRISKAAGFAKGTIYNYFPSKRELMLALIDEIAAAHTDAILQRVESEQDPVRRLELFFSEGFAFVESQPARAQVVISAVYGPDGRFRARVYQAYERLFTLIAQDIVETGLTQGDFRSVDPDLVTALIMSIYLGSCSQLAPDGKIWLDPDQVVAFILDGLRPR